MADFQQSYPKHKSYKCNFYWHLHSSGLELACYELVEHVTLGGKNEFFGSLEKVAAYFGSSYSVIHRVFKKLVKKGWLTYDKKNRHYWYVSHADWSRKHQGQCNVRELAPWQEDTDPFVGCIYAECAGKVKLFERQVAWFRKLASEEEFLRKLRELMAEAKAKRVPGGDWSGTSPKQVLWRTADFFKEHKETNGFTVESSTYR